MLRVVVVESSAGAKRYYSRGDYYAEDGQELPGTWGGKGSERLGLAGEVDGEAFGRLCENRNPKTGRPLTPVTKAGRRVAYDFNFHVPKSVSVLFGLTGSAEILKAFRASVEDTLQELEGLARTRVRAGGRDELRTTGELAWASFVHTTSRPVGGVPDPHLHLHAVAFNATFDPVEQRWKAAEVGDVKRDARYFEAAFHARLADRLSRLGYDVVRTGKGWELAGVPERVIREFSRRTQAIEKAAAEQGVTDAKTKDRLGALTRERKRTDLSPDDLRAAWLARVTADELRALGLVVGKALDVPAADPNAAREAVRFAVDHCFERQAVVPLRTVLEVALRRGVGQVTVEGVRRELAALGLLVRERDGRPYVTTREVLEEEVAMLAFARSGRGRCVPLGDPTRPLSRDWLGAEQTAVLRHVLGSCDRVILLRGAAGTGKTALMKEAVEGINAGGKRVLVMAPSAVASRSVLREVEGFDAADTVARFLVDERQQGSARGQVLWVDEAGLLGSRQVAKLFALAARLDARVILSGDRRQHAPVERGSVLRLLEQEAGLPVAQLVAIRRQRGRYRDAVALLADGRTADGFAVLDALGWVTEVSGDERVRRLAADYLATVSAGKSALVVSPTHAEGRAVTTAVRAALRAAGRLADDERPFDRLDATDLTTAERGDPARYEPGDVIEFHQHAPAFKSGSRWSVVKVGRGSLLVGDGNGRNAVLPLTHAQRFQVFRRQELRLAVGDAVRVTKNGRSRDNRRLDNGAVYIVRGFTAAGDIQLDSGAVIGRGWGHLAFGYCVTSHASQGRTVDRVFVAVGSESFAAASAAQFYVSASRGRERVTVYTDDKRALLGVIGRDTPRLTATELVRVDALSGWRAWLARRVRGVQRMAAALGLVGETEQGRSRAMER